MERRTYASLAAAVEATLPLKHSYWPTPRVRYYADADGNTIPDWKIEEVTRHLSTYVVYRRRRARHVHRQGPVEGISCRRGGRHYYRRIATTAELRENDFLWYDEDAVEHRIEPRPARRRGTLPTFWDDGRFAERGNGWKNYREKQYRG